MISFVVGKLASVGDASVVIECQGMGFEILVPGSFLERMPAEGTEIKIYTHFHVREDAMQLFGFESQADKDLFELLITVNGIGPKGGMALMGTLTGDDIRFAIMSGDEKAISKAPGIGAKTAKKMIFELRDKINMLDSVEAVREHGAQGDSVSEARQMQEDAIEALKALGYSSTDAAKAVHMVALTGDMTVEELLKLSLKHI